MTLGRKGLSSLLSSFLAFCAKKQKRVSKRFLTHVFAIVIERSQLALFCTVSENNGFPF